MQVRKQQLELAWNSRWVPKRKRSMSRLYIVTLLIEGSTYILPYIHIYVEYIMRNAGLEEAQAGIKSAERNINNLRYAVTPPLWQKVKKN